jgi:hypothetical protein
MSLCQSVVATIVRKVRILWFINRGQAELIGPQLNTGFSSSQSMYFVRHCALFFGSNCGFSFTILCRLSIPRILRTFRFRDSMFGIAHFFEAANCAIQQTTASWFTVKWNTARLAQVSGEQHPVPDVAASCRKGFSLRCQYRNWRNSVRESRAALSCAGQAPVLTPGSALRLLKSRALSLAPGQANIVCSAPMSPRNMRFASNGQRTNPCFPAKSALSHHRQLQWIAVDCSFWRGDLRHIAARDAIDTEFLIQPRKPQPERFVALWQLLSGELEICRAHCCIAMECGFASNFPVNHAFLQMSLIETQFFCDFASFASASLRTKDLRQLFRKFCAHVCVRHRGTILGGPTRATRS